MTRRPNDCLTADYRGVEQQRVFTDQMPARPIDGDEEGEKRFSDGQ